MKKEKKVEQVELLKGVFGTATATVVTNYEGLKASEMAALRRCFHDVGVNYRVVKNNLARLALKDSAIEGLSEHLVQTIAIATTDDDQTGPAKALAKFYKDNPKIDERLQIVCGTLDNEILNPDQVKRLSDMPGKPELRAQLLGLFNNVPGGFVRLLNAVPGGMVNVLDARRREMEGEAA